MSLSPSASPPARRASACASPPPPSGPRADRGARREEAAPPPGPARQGEPADRRRARIRAPVADRKRTPVRRLQPALRERRHNRDLKPALPGMDDGLRQRAPHRRAARPHHPPCPYPGDERRELPAQAEPVTTPATVRITPRLSPWAHGPLPRAGQRQPRIGRVAPRAGPSRGLRGQATTEPVVHFCAAAPVHIPAAVDTRPSIEMRNLAACKRSRTCGAAASPAGCGTPAPGRAISGCSRPASRPGRDGVRRHAAAPYRRPTISARARNRRSPSCVYGWKIEPGKGIFGHGGRGAFAAWEERRWTTNFHLMTTTYAMSAITASCRPK